MAGGRVGQPKKKVSNPPPVIARSILTRGASSHKEVVSAGLDVQRSESIANGSRSPTIKEDLLRKPMFLRQWAPDFEIKEDLLRVLPVWIQFPHLPLQWGTKSISKLASVVGRPVVTAECTTKNLRVSYCGF